VRPPQPRERLPAQMAEPVAHPRRRLTAPPTRLQSRPKLVTDRCQGSADSANVPCRPRRHHTPAPRAPVTPKQQGQDEAVEVPPHETMSPHPITPAPQTSGGPRPRETATLSEHLMEFHRYLPYHVSTVSVGSRPKGNRAESSRKTLRPLRFCNPVPPTSGPPRIIRESRRPRQPILNILTQIHPAQCGDQHFSPAPTAPVPP